MRQSQSDILNAFCVDLEEWFHICGVSTDYDDTDSWDQADSRVERNTDVLLGLLDEAGAKGTFLSVGWIGERYPALIRKISELGHEIGSHGYYHRLVYGQRPEEFREELSRSKKLLEDISGQAVTCFRAPGFSMKRECFWAYPILAEQGFTIDVSIVPASRDHGGVVEMSSRPFELETGSGMVKVFPVSVMTCFGRTIPFSGGGYLRLFPMAMVHWGFRQNHGQGLPVMAYIHPREIDPDQPRMALPGKKAFKYYVNLKRTENKLRQMLRVYRFGTVAAVMAEFSFTNRFSFTHGDFQVIESEEDHVGNRVPNAQVADTTAVPV